MNPLSRTECASLPIGALVKVKWSGGNGPHLYRVATHWHTYSGLVIERDWELYQDAKVDRNWLEAQIGDKWIGDGPMSFVGDGKPYTVVYKVQE